MEFNNDYDVIVIGAGHAGIEAALASARMNVKTVIFTINFMSVGNCPCSPSIGGMAKGTLVREIDALGGEMAKMADKCFIHSKILGLSKGAATHSLRVQVDKDRYKIIAKHTLETEPNLHLKQAQVVKILKKEKWQVYTQSGIAYESKCLILACGTYLNARVHIGLNSFESGPDGIFPAFFLSEAIKKLNIETERFKTGTPARILKSSINFPVLEIQNGDKNVTPFSFDNDEIGGNKSVCHIAYTNNNTKEIILKNLNKSGMYNGSIKGIGPRYCPSLEDKMVRFGHKERHQIFVEPCGLENEEIYLHGTSSSLPEEIQVKFYRSIRGFENAMIMKPAYAIEYDIVKPIQLKRSLEFKEFSGLFSAGQINGTSGYEEAAAQGLIAGINAASLVLGRNSIVLERSSSYIGTLIDDLVFKGVTDPYRMMTSRSEYRLLLRLDNADERLMPMGKKIGLVKSSSWDKFKKRLEQKEYTINKFKKFLIKPKKNDLVQKPSYVLDLLKRPGLNYEIIKSFDKDLGKELSKIPDKILKCVEIFIKYEGYIKKQIQNIEKMKKFKKKEIPKNINYFNIKNLSFEAREKLEKYKPDTIFEAMSISGVNPSDITLLMIHIEKINCKK